MPILQDEAEECLGEMFVSDVIINKLQVEELLQADIISELNVGEGVDIISDITAHQDVGISGCLFLNQPLINLRNDSGADDRDIGFFSAYQDPTGVTYYTGLVRDATDKTYKLFDKATNITEICSEVDFTGITWSDLEIGRLDIKRSLDENSFKVAEAKYGDLMVGISGTFQILPLDSEDKVLTVNLDSPLGVTWEYPKYNNLKHESGSWVDQVTKYGYTRVSSNLTLLNSNIYTRVFKKKYVGTRSYSVINEVEDGAMGYFDLTKSSRDIDGHVAKLTGIASYTGGLISKWTKKVDIELGKCSLEAEGDYLAIANWDPDCAPEEIKNSLFSEVDLIGISYSQIESSTKGNFMFHIDNDLTGPTGIFYATKGKEDGYASIARISHSPSTDFNKLEIRWEPNSGIELHKTKSTFDGTYRIIPIHDQYIKEVIVNLTSNDFTTDILIDEYERIVTIVTVESLDNDGASAIFIVSKNHIDNQPHIVRLTSTQSGEGWDRLEIIGVDPPSIDGPPTNLLVVNPFEIVGVPRKCSLATAPDPEQIELVWDQDDRLKIRKNTTAMGSELYDGQYKIRIYEYFP